MLTNTIQRFSYPRAACKQWSAGLGVLILLIGALAGLNPTKMLWAAAPLLLIGLVEAGYAAQAPDVNNQELTPYPHIVSVTFPADPGTSIKLNWTETIQQVWWDPSDVPNGWHYGLPIDTFELDITDLVTEGDDP